MGGWRLAVVLYTPSDLMGRKHFTRNPISGNIRFISKDIRISVSLYEGVCEKHNGAINPKTINQATPLKFAALLAKLPCTRRQNSTLEAAGIQKTI